jgi:hypothetical protein
MSAFRNLNPVFEQGPDYIRLQVFNPDGVLAIAAAIDSITYRVIEYANQQDAEKDHDGEEVLAETELTPLSDYVFSPRSWSLDSTGYNFELLSPGTNRPNGNKWQRHQITFTPQEGPPYMEVTINEILAVN